MGSIKTPEWVEPHLSDGEKVFGKYSTGFVSYWATDRRMLRFPKRAECESLPYDGLRTVSRDRIVLFAISSLILVVSGLLMIGLGIFGFIGPEIRTGGRITNTKAPLCVSCAACLAGLLPVAIPITLPFGYHQFESPELAAADERKWRLPRDLFTARKAGRFIQVVKEMSSASE